MAKRLDVKSTFKYEDNNELMMLGDAVCYDDNRGLEVDGIIIGFTPYNVQLLIEDYSNACIEYKHKLIKPEKLEAFGQLFNT